MSLLAKNAELQNRRHFLRYQACVDELERKNCVIYLFVYLVRFPPSVSLVPRDRLMFDYVSLLGK